MASIAPSPLPQFHTASKLVRDWSSSNHRKQNKEEIGAPLWTKSRWFTLALDQDWIRFDCRVFFCFSISVPMRVFFGCSHWRPASWEHEKLLAETNPQCACLRTNGTIWLEWWLSLASIFVSHKLSLEPIQQQDQRWPSVSCFDIVFVCKCHQVHN